MARGGLAAQNVLVGEEQRRSGRFSLRRLNADGRLERVPASPTLPAVAGAAQVPQKLRAFRHNQSLATLRALCERA